MYDNNENMEKKENNEDSITDDKKEFCILLKDIAIESEEHLYNIRMQIKSKAKLLDIREKEIIEQDRTMTHNLNLFSPIYLKSSNLRSTDKEIEQLKTEIEKLEIEQDQIYKKIIGLKKAATYIENSEKKELYDKAIDGRRKYSDSGLSILEAQEIERKRIARDLHDSTVQNLTSLVHKCELCNKLIDIDSTRAKLELITMSNTIKTVINDMRGIIYNLRPMTLDDLGLSITIKRFANKLMDLNNINVKVSTNEEVKEILPVIKLTLFRIIQEACTNVIKHANASEINIDIIFEEKNVTVIIKDNGSGFGNKQSDENVTQASSFGLSIMRERISLLSGTIEIQSEREIGTTVIVSVPITIYEGDKNEKTD